MRASALYEDHDPEFPDEKYTVFSVEVKADVPMIMRMEAEWVRRVRCEAGTTTTARLSIIPKP